MQTFHCASSKSANPPILAYGSSGEFVSELQWYLAQYGYYNDKIDGRFGSNTDMAVRSFQRVNGLGVDGSVGPLTWGKMLSGNVLAVEEQGGDASEEKDRPSAETDKPEDLGDADINDLDKLPKDKIRDLGGEEYTQGVKGKTGKSKSDLYWDKSGNVYTVPKNGGPPQWVDWLPR